MTAPVAAPIARRCCMPLLALAVVASPAAGQDNVLVQLLTENRHELRLEQGALTGPGGELLVREGRAAQIVLVGEEHGVAEIPALAAAWLRRLVPAGFRYVAIEVSPLGARVIESMIQPPDPSAALRTAFRDPLYWLPFYTLDAERELLAAAVGPSGTAMRVWGLDYEVMGDALWLRRLEEIVPSGARDAVTAARARADSGLTRLRESGDPSLLFAFTAPGGLLAAIREAARPDPGGEVDAILSVLEATNAINTAWTAGRVYESNLLRAEYLKRNLLAYYREAESRDGAPPRVFGKFGTNHVYRGLNETRTWDIGTLAHELAFEAGSQTFAVMVVGGPETERAQFDPTILGYRAVPAAGITHSWLAPVRAALPLDDWMLFDLRPLRAPIVEGRLRDVHPEMERLIFGFDAIVVLAGSTSGLAP